MHRIKSHAHTSAHKHRFNPWSTDSTVATNAGLPPPTDTNGDTVTSEPEKSTPKTPIFRRLTRNLRVIFLRSWLNVLLIFVPAGIAVHFAGINDNVVFALNAIAVIPLAGLLTFGTECVAHRLGPTLGALLNVSFGNAVELIIFIIALVKNEIRVVQAALIGSILANLLLILGMALVVGGLQYREQVYDSLVTQMSAALLAMAVLSLLIPTAFHASFSDLDAADAAVLKLSRGTSIILLIIYLLYLAFQLKSHSYLYQGIPQSVIDAETHPGPGPGILARMNTSSSSSSSTTSVSTHSGSQRRVRKRLRIGKLGRSRKETIETTDEPESTLDEKPSASKGKETADAPTPAPQPPTSATQPPPTTNHNTDSRPKLGLKQRSFAPPVFRNTPPPRSYTDIHHPHQNRPHRQHENSHPPLHRLRTDPRTFHTDNTLYYTSSPRQLTPSNSGLPNTMNPSPTDTANDTSDPELSQFAAIVLLLCTTALVALCAEFMVGAINHLVESSPLSEAFIGLILLPIIGNAAEHVTAVTVAAKNKLDLSLGVSLGSSIQIALFITPVVVVLGWILDKEMSLYFSLFETVSVFGGVFVVNFLVLDGRSNYLEGALLCACYVIIAVGAYLFPDAEGQSLGTSGPGGE